MHTSFCSTFLCFETNFHNVLFTEIHFPFSDGKMATEDGEEQSLIKLQRLQTENGIDCSSDNRMVIKRPVYSQAKFDEGFKCDKRQHETLPSYCKKQLEHCHCSSCLQFLPFIGIMRKYSLKKDFFSDLVAGLTVGIMHIPQGTYIFSSLLSFV